MKLTIEINDSALRAAVEGEVGKAIANMAEETIKKKLDDVLEAKLERIAKNLISKSDVVLQKEVQKVLDETMGKYQHNKTEFVRSIISNIMMEQIRKG